MQPPDHLEEDSFSDKSDMVWLTSYGDMMTILLVFFVLLISASQISSLKFEKIKQSFQGKSEEGLSIELIYQQMKEKVAAEQLQSFVEVTATDRNINIVLKDRLLFDMGKVTIKPQNLKILQGIVQLFHGLPEYARVAIEGYTDDNPIRNHAYRSNWHLSVLRALSVLEVFDQQGLCQDNCELRGYGNTVLTEKIEIRKEIPLRTISRKIDGWSSRFFRWSNWSICLVLFSSCVSERDRFTADGKRIPGRALLDTRRFEYLCEPLLTKSHKEIESILDRYGKNGWRFAGFLTAKGTNYAFCLEK